MKESVILLFPIALPVLAGVLWLIGKAPKRKYTTRVYVGGVLAVTALLCLFLLSGGERFFTLFYLTARLPIFFRLDGMGKLFCAAAALVWTAAGFFSFGYLEGQPENKRFFGFYLIGYGVMNALCFSGNLITFYAFYEMLTLLTMPLVLHERTKEAVFAGLKYLFFSLCGAYMVLFGLYFVYRYSNTLSFTARGVLDMGLAEGHEGLLLLAAFLMLLGFSVKAGMFPFHSWLPVAHPVAPAPASAVLSAVIVKAGVLGIVRAAYYIFGAAFLRGSWVQTAMLTLSLVTVFLGSMLACLEDGLKKRLAYSTVSQVSYILFGLFLFDTVGMTGALLQTLFHAVIKGGLFLCAGAVICQTGRKRAGELAGIGRVMPVTMACFTVCSLALIGIPPASGFIGKWFLCTGALHTKLPVFSWLGPVVLLLSALLTAAYLLPVAIRSFFAGPEPSDALLEEKKKDPKSGMLLPLLILAALSLLLGIVPETLIESLSALAGQLI